MTTSIKTDFKLKNLIGRGSGETMQMAFSRPGLGARAALRGPGRAAARAGQRRAGNLLERLKRTSAQWHFIW